MSMLTMIISNFRQPHV